MFGVTGYSADDRGTETLLPVTASAFVTNVSAVTAVDSDPRSIIGWSARRLFR